MDGINPTLAFAVLFFGLSGNAPDTTHQPPARAQIEDSCRTHLPAGDPTLLARESDPVQRPMVPAANMAAGADAVVDSCAADR
jgi:hypothetical protein